MPACLENLHEIATTAKTMNAMADPLQQILAETLSPYAEIRRAGMCDK